MTTQTDRTRASLALSGGGFRATLYHCGALIRLNQMGWLPRLERIASVSGGSITAGRLAVRWDKLVFGADGSATNLDDEVIGPLRDFCKRNVDLLSVGFGSFMPGKSIGDVLADSYDEHLCDHKSLQDLPDVPQFIFKATNLQTGRMVRLSKRRLADYRIGEIANPDIRVAVAVAASSAFPPVLSPMEIKTDPDKWVKLEGADLHDDETYSKRLVLSDGGVYDNLGLEGNDTFKTILVSDAGAPFAMQVDRDTMWHQQAMRALDIATDQARGLRKRMLFADARAADHKVAFWGIDLDASKGGGPQGGLTCPREVTEKLARIRTRLDSFSTKEQGQLINWGYAACDLMMRTYVDTAAPPPQGWPCPAQALG